MAEVSTISTLPSTVQRYIELTHRKQALLDEAHQIHLELKSMKDPMMDLLVSSGKPVFQICPSKEEEVKYGAMGSLAIKVKNDFESITYNTLIRLLHEYFTYMLHDGDPLEIVLIAQGTASWIWHNRKRNPTRYLDRTFAEKKPAKRKEPPADGAVQKKPQARPKPMENMPHTRDDFMQLKSFGRLFTSESLEKLDSTVKTYKNKSGGDVAEVNQDEVEDEEQAME